MADTFPAAPAPALGADGFPKSGWTPPDTGVQLAPGGAAAAQAGGYAPVQPAAVPAPPPVPQPASAPVKAAPDVRYLSGRPRTGTFDLVEPVAVNGVEIRQVVIKRMSTGEIADFANRMRDSDDVVRYPIFHRVDGALLTDDEWGALDPDDTDTLSEKCTDFLPARLRRSPKDSASTPST